MDHFKAIGLKAAFAKSGATFFMGTAGGLITVLQVFFPDSPHYGWAFAAVFGFFVAAVGYLACGEIAVRRVMEPPTSSWLAWAPKIFGTSANREWVYSLASTASAFMAVIFTCAFFFLTWFVD